MFLSIITEIIKGLIVGMGSYGSKTFPDPLKKEEEEKLIKQMLNKDKNARNKLVEHNEYIREYGKDMDIITNWKWEKDI